LASFKAGIRIAIRIAMIAITTSSSTNVKPLIFIAIFLSGKNTSKDSDRKQEYPKWYSFLIMAVSPHIGRMRKTGLLFR